MLVLYINTLQLIFTGKPAFIRTPLGEKIGWANWTWDGVTLDTCSTTSPQASMWRTANLLTVVGSAKEISALRFYRYTININKGVASCFCYYICLPVQIQCGRYASSNFPVMTVTSSRGPPGMYCMVSSLSMCSSQEPNWYFKLTFSLQTQRSPEILHSKCPASDCRLI